MSSLVTRRSVGARGLLRHLLRHLLRLGERRIFGYRTGVPGRAWGGGLSVRIVLDSAGCQSYQCPSLGTCASVFPQGGVSGSADAACGSGLQVSGRRWRRAGRFLDVRGVLDLADHLCWAMFGGHRAHGSGGLLNHRLSSHGSQAIASGATGWADCGEAQGHRAAGEFSLV